MDFCEGGISEVEETVGYQEIIYTAWLQVGVSRVVGFVARG
jgi:hypothetical protein